MPLPGYQQIMLPLLRMCADDTEHSLREAIQRLTVEFCLTESEQRELLPSGQQTIFENRVGWARTYLKKAGLLTSTRRGFFQITPRGMELLRTKPNEITAKSLRQYPEFQEFQKASNTTETLDSESEDSPVKKTPEELLEESYQTIRKSLAQDILQKVKDGSPSFFERLVVELLVAMGYGGSRRDAGEAIGKSGDEGIDGIIKEDKLGLDTIYIQAKRWENVVGRPEIQKFVGALQGQRARKGVFITTSYFSSEAKDYTSRVDSKIILIDGEQLSQLMIDYSIGTSQVASYLIKRIDADYFVEE